MKYAGMPMGMWALSAARADTITRYLFCCSMSGGLLDRTAHHRSDLINGIALTPVQTIFFHGKQFLTELLQAMGVEATGSTVAEMMSEAILTLKRKATPIIILDEADKLSDQVLYFFISLYNKLEDHCGIIICATDYLKKRITRGVKANRKGYKEIYSRVGRKFIPMPVVNGEDIAAVCVANGITDRATIEEIIDDSECDLRRVKRRVHAEKKQLSNND